MVDSESGEKKVYLKARGPESLHREFKKAAIDEKRSMEEIVAELVEYWLKSRKEG